MKNKALLKAIIHCDSILSLPSIYKKITDKIENPNTTNNELAEIVKLDPGVSSKLLAIVNSSFYGFQKQISSISQAISIIGLNDFRNLILGSSVVSLFKKDEKTKFSLEDFWSYSLNIAILSKLLASHWKVKVEIEDIFIAGLLHDVGKLVILQSTPNKIEELLQCWENNDTENETTILGYNHAEAGAELVKRWELPDTLYNAIAQHHKIANPTESSICTLIINLANCILLKETDNIQSLLSILNETHGRDSTIEELNKISDEAKIEKNTLIKLYLS